MKNILLISFVLILFIHAKVINFGSWNKAQFQEILQNNNPSQISEYFINKPYLSNTLIGNSYTKEEFVIDFRGVDCFTYIDYIESIRRSISIDAFELNLQKLRYKDSKISYKNRNHFFSDWIINNNFEDITYKISNKKAITISKELNKKDIKSKYLDDIPIIKRDISYIPTKYITPKVLSQLKTGDYIGIYTNLNGLDVSHVGILIKEDKNVYFRHASSSKLNQKVVTIKLIEYMKNKPGLIVLRAKE